MKNFNWLIKYLFIFFILFFLIINWDSISWIFNYKVIFGFFTDLGERIANIPHKIYSLLTLSWIEIPQSNPKTNNIAGRGEGLSSYIANPIGNSSEKEDSIEIPKIMVKAPLIKISKQEEAKNALNKGVVLFPGSVSPEDNGIILILGHSAPPNWPKIRYDWVFSKLEELNEGDEVLLYLNHREYKYQIQKKFFLFRGENLSEEKRETNVLTLISCWPPGKDYKRIAVEATLKK